MNKELSVIKKNIGDKKAELIKELIKELSDIKNQMSNEQEKKNYDLKDIGDKKAERKADQRLRQF